MNDTLRTFAEFGAQLGGRSEKTARRIVKRDGVPTYLVGASRLVRQSDIDAWIEAHIEPAAEPALGTRLQQIRDGVKARRLERRAS